MQETTVQFLGQEDLLEKGQATLSSILGLPLGSAGKESACNAGDLGSIPGLGRFSWRREQLPTPAFWPGQFHGLYVVHRVAKSQARLSNFHFHLGYASFNPAVQTPNPFRISQVKSQICHSHLNYTPHTKSVSIMKQLLFYTTELWSGQFHSNKQDKYIISRK